jgi:quercetin dioxygenase-like cupin family protein
VTVDTLNRILKTFNRHDLGVDGRLANRHGGQRHDDLNMSREDRMTRDDLRQYIITEQEAESYTPPHHVDTTNRLYLPKGALGSRQFEVVVGAVKPGGGAEPHFHDGTEQIMFILRGQGLSEMEGEQFEIGPRTLIFHPPGQMHRVLAVSDDFEALVVYSPPFGVKRAAAFRSR